MPTPLDRALQSRNLFLTFTGVITAVAAWSIWGSDMFPAKPPSEPQGEPESWTLEELRGYLRARGGIVGNEETKEGLVARVKRVKGA